MRRARARAGPLAYLGEGGRRGVGVGRCLLVVAEPGVGATELAFQYGCGPPVLGDAPPAAQAAGEMPDRGVVVIGGERADPGVLSRAAFPGPVPAGPGDLDSGVGDVGGGLDVTAAMWQDASQRAANTSARGSPQALADSRAVSQASVCRPRPAAALWPAGALTSS